MILQHSFAYVKRLGGFSGNGASSKGRPLLYAARICRPLVRVAGSRGRACLRERQGPRTRNPATARPLGLATGTGAESVRPGRLGRVYCCRGGCAPFRPNSIRWRTGFCVSRPARSRLSQLPAAAPPARRSRAEVPSRLDPSAWPRFPGTSSNPAPRLSGAMPPAGRQPGSRTQGVLGAARWRRKMRSRSKVDKPETVREEVAAHDQDAAHRRNDHDQRQQLVVKLQMHEGRHDHARLDQRQYQQDPEHD